MPIDYDPKDAVLCWPEGDYDAVLDKVEDKTSKIKPDGSGGNPMQVLTWTVYHPDGRQQSISDYIVVPTGLFKLRQLATALGKKTEFDAGRFQADDQIGCTVTASLAIEQQEGFDDKNRIARVKPKAGTFTRPERKPVTAPDLSQPQFKEDDIPF